MVNTLVAVGPTAAMVALWFVFSCTADAAPKALRSSLLVSTQVVAVDCTAYPVKKKACAPVIVIRDKLTGDPNIVVKTVHFY